MKTIGTAIIISACILGACYFFGKMLDYKLEIKRMELQERWGYDPSTDPTVIYGSNVTAE